AVVLPRFSARFGAFALLAQAIRGAVAVVREALLDKRCGGGAMPIVALRLEVRGVRATDARPFIPVEPNPLHAVENARDHLGGRTLGVGVLDAKDERAAMPPRVQPVEEG